MKHSHKAFALLLTFIFLYSPLSADVATDLMQGIFAEGVTVNLREPIYCEGVLSTDKGGVITGANIRIQAQKIVYTRQQSPEATIFTVEAEEDLMVEFGEYVFVGYRLEYDFQAKTGVIYQGRTAFEPWFIGGRKIFLGSDGSYSIYNGYLTTSEGEDFDWELSAECANLLGNRLKAKNVQFRVFSVPVFWLPYLNINLDWIFDNPIRYRLRMGGRQGPRIAMIYEVFSWNRWKGFLRVDYRLRRGFGGGFETEYLSADHKTYFETINYVASDSSISNPHEKTRYRLQGVFGTLLMDDKVSIDGSYDKISDIDMPSDYNDRTLELETAGKTQLEIRRQEAWWIADFLTRIRVNNFQTVKQELPTFGMSWHPVTLGTTGIISDHYCKASYLDFAYANNTVDVKNFNSTRVELSQKLYRPMNLGVMTVTPQAGVVAIVYGNSPGGASRWLTAGLFECECNTHLYKFYGLNKHEIVPYSNYQYYTFPTVSPDQHYIFDIDDGWYRLNMLRFGVRQSIYLFGEEYLGRYLYLDVYANAFFDTPTIPCMIPKTYLDIVWNPLSVLRYTVNTAWNTMQNDLDHFNLRAQWTVNTNLAVAAEYRHRNAYDWRKADHENYILDSFRSVNELRHSTLSDRRDTALLHFFYRFRPTWAFELESQHGWNREDERSYNEFACNLIGTLPGAANVMFSYQHREGDHRVVIYFSIGLKRPEGRSCFIPSLDF